MSEPLVERIVLHVEGPRGGEVDSYCQPTVVIGRAPDCHLVFPTERGVSGHHAVIRLHDGMVELEDTHSTNGTFVNDVRVDRCALKHDDTIRLGSIGPLLRVELPDRAHAELPLAPTPPPANRVPVAAPAPQPPKPPPPPPLQPTQHQMPSPSPAVQRARATAPQTPLPAASAPAPAKSTRSQSSSTVVALIVIGVLIVLGSGALWFLLHRFH
jgi:hypothetical protein